MLPPRLSLEVFVPRSEKGVSELCEPLLRQLCDFGPALLSLSGYQLGEAGGGSRIAAAVQSHAVRLQLHLPRTGTTRARAAWVVDECARAGVRDLLLLPGHASANPGPDEFGTLLELVRFIKEKSAGAVRCAVPGYPRGSTGECGVYEEDLQQLRLQLRAGASCVLCQPVYDASAISALVADLGDDLAGCTLSPTLLPIQSNTEFSRVTRGLGLTPPAWLRSQLQSARSDDAVRQVSTAALSKLATALRGMPLPVNTELVLHVATLNGADSLDVLRTAGFTPLVHRTRGPGLAPRSEARIE